MARFSHLRLVFPEADAKVFTALKTMKNPHSKKHPLFVNENEKALPDGRVELLSCPMPSLMVDTAPAVIGKGKFPHLEGYLVKSFEGDHAVYGKEAGLQIELETRMDAAARATQQILQKFCKT